jgi:hypothetical protein
VLEGSLKDFSLTDIFQLMALTKKTGALTVRTDGQEGRVLFRGGEVTFAVADVQRVALGARLVAAGIVHEDQITRVLERKRDEGGEVLALLLDEAVLDEGAVDTFLRTQIEDAVFDLMRLETAGFSFDAAEEDDGTVGLTVATGHLITEGAKRLGDWSAIREHVPSLDAVLALSAQPSVEGDRVSVHVEDWQLLALVDGRRTVRDIVELTGKGEFTTSKRLADLVRQGYISVAAPDGDGGALAGMVARREMLRRLEELELGERVAPPAPVEPVSPPGEEPGAPAMPEAPFQGPGDLAPPVTEPEPQPAPEPAANDSAQPPGEEAGPVDRSQVARELASLGLDSSAPTAPAHREDGAEAGDSADGATQTNGNHHLEGDRQVRPLTRDQDVNKGLLLRLIDGVKEA